MRRNKKQRNSRSSFPVRAVIDYYRRINKELFLFFWDLEKCFDKLWLKDCIIELWRTKIPANKAYLIYLMNKQSKIQIDTPVGMTNTIQVNEIFGPILCGIVTDKINNFVVNVNETIGADLSIGTLMYVDDICGTGSKDNIERVIKNCKAAEEKKKMTFSAEKSIYIKILFKKAESPITNEIQQKVTKGKIKETNVYKYLGNFIDNKGSNMTNIEKQKEKIPFMINEMMKYGDTNEVGGKALS